MNFYFIYLNKTIHNNIIQLTIYVSNYFFQIKYTTRILKLYYTIILIIYFYKIFFLQCHKPLNLKNYTKTLRNTIPNRRPNYIKEITNYYLI